MGICGQASKKNIDTNELVLTQSDSKTDKKIVQNKSKTKIKTESNKSKHLINAKPNKKNNIRQKISSRIDSKEINYSAKKSSLKDKKVENNIEFKSFSKAEKDICNIQNQPKIIDKFENNLNKTQIQTSSKEIYNKAKKFEFNNINYDTFPKGTEYEEELNKNFKYFNIYWYDKNKTDDFDNFKKCFENVQFYKGNNLYSIIDFFKKELISEWIVITSGSSGEELILNLENFKCIKSFFIYCKNTKYHEEWTNKVKKLGCLTSDPEILCRKFIEINKNYIIPNFNYNNVENNENIYKLNIKYNEDNYKINSQIIKLLIQTKNIQKEKYNNLCIKLLNYLNSDDIINDLKEIITEEGSPLYLVAKTLPGIEEQLIQTNINNIKNLTLLSLYFSKYPYLLNLLSYQEVEDFFNTEINVSMIMNFENKIFPILEKLSQKIMNNESILNEKDDLREIQISCFYKLHYSLIIAIQDSSIFVNYNQIINFLRDIDFCLKILVTMMISIIKNKKQNFLDEIIFSLQIFEPRYRLYNHYLNQLSPENKFIEKEQNLIEDSLTIKDFIIVGNNEFYEKIKIIEKYVNSRTFIYLNIEQILDYFESKKKDKSINILPYFYFLIIELEDFQKNYEKIIFLSMKSGITFMAFVFVENDDKSKILKNQINLLIPTIIVYSLDDINRYLSQKFHFNNPINNNIIEELSEILKIKIPKISFEQNDEDQYQNGCFELAETFDVNIIRNKFIFRILNDIDYTFHFSRNIYNIYKDHNALDLFYSQNCIYFGWNLYPELISFNICFVKRILYLYCREEKESNKSLYRIINDDLRSRDPYKIYQYIDILALINQLIEEKGLYNFKGIVYRATKLDENLILKLIPGAKMVNTTFWSTSKDFNVAEQFMINHNWRNTFIICKTSKNNIDIDSEKLNPFNEKEVLFTPFTEFLVEKVSNEIKYGKKIYIIELTEIENRNFVNSDNMQVENINSLGITNEIDKCLKNNGEEVINQIKNNIKFD